MFETFLFLLGGFIKCFICHLCPAYQPSPQPHPFNLPTHSPHKFLCGLIFAGFANFCHNCENKSSLSRKSSKMGWHKKDNCPGGQIHTQIVSVICGHYPRGHNPLSRYCPGGQNSRPDNIRCYTDTHIRALKQTRARADAYTHARIHTHTYSIGLWR